MLVGGVALLRFSAYEQALQGLREQIVVLRSQQAQAIAESQRQLCEFRAVFSNFIRQHEELSRAAREAYYGSSKAKKLLLLSRGNPATIAKYPGFRSTQNVKISQHTDGSIAVESSDPALLGKMIVVEAVHADGTADAIPITIPPSPIVNK